MLPAIAFTGFSDAGKTTLVTKVIEELTSRGYKVAAVKHEGGGHGLKRDEEKDSERHKAAGAAVSIVSSADGILMDCDTGRDTPVEALLALLPGDIDIAICEGFKRSSLPKIEVVRDENIRANKGDKNLIAIAFDGSYEGSEVPVLDVDKVGVIADFIEDRFLSAKQEIRLHLVVDGEPISTKDHLTKMLAYSTKGLIRALKACENPKEILIRVVSEEK